MKKSTIVTVLIIILIGIMITDINLSGSGVFELFFRRLETNSIHDIGIDFNTNAKYEYSVEKNLNIAKDSRNELVINNSLGSIEIIGEERNDIDIKAKITVYSSEKEVGRDYAENIDISPLKNTSSIIINSPENNLEEVKGVKIDYIIKAPQEMYLDLYNQHGKLEVSNFLNGVDLSNKYKETIVEDINGEKIKISAKYGKLYLSEIGNNGDELEVNTAYSSSTINNVNRNLKIDASYGELDLNNISGKIDSRLRYGEAYFYNIGEMTLDSRYTKVKIDEIDGKLKAYTDYGSITVDDVKYDTLIEGRYTEISVELAKELSNYVFEGKTEYGDIKTNLEVKQEKRDQMKIATFEKGSGDKKISLRTEHENINIRQN